MSILNFFIRANESALLMDAMIDKLGLRSKMEKLPDHRNVLKRAGNRCLTCDRPDECADWLAARETANEAPFYCKNHDLFERVKDRHEDA